MESLIFCWSQVSGEGSGQDYSLWRFWHILQFESVSGSHLILRFIYQYIQAL